MISCSACELSLSRKRIVNINGPSNARYILITSHPSKIDEVRGKIFSGEECRLLELLIEEVCFKTGAIPWEFLIIPMVRCRPKKTEKHSIKTRDPKVEEILACNQNLFYELNKTKYHHIFFDGKIVERYYRREFPDAITLPSIKLLVEQGGHHSPWFRTAIRILIEGIQK